MTLENPIHNNNSTNTRIKLPIVEIPVIAEQHMMMQRLLANILPGKNKESKQTNLQKCVEIVCLCECSSITLL